nr:vegetative cell wall protein gp1-like [Salvelinus alpinus]
MPQPSLQSPSSPSPASGTEQPTQISASTLPKPHPASSPPCLNPTLPQPHSASTPLCLNPTLPPGHLLYPASTLLCYLPCGPEHPEPNLPPVYFQALNTLNRTCLRPFQALNTLNPTCLPSIPGPEHPEPNLPPVHSSPEHPEPNLPPSIPGPEHPEPNLSPVHLRPWTPSSHLAFSSTTQAPSPFPGLSSTPAQMPRHPPPPSCSSFILTA